MPGKTFRHPERFFKGHGTLLSAVQTYSPIMFKKTQLVDKKVPFAKYDSHLDSRHMRGNSSIELSAAFVIVFALICDHFWIFGLVKLFFGCLLFCDFFGCLNHLMFPRHSW